jgi:hypothetical protein
MPTAAARRTLCGEGSSADNATVIGTPASGAVVAVAGAAGRRALPALRAFGRAWDAAGAAGATDFESTMDMMGS